jgi:hypothetical protein
MGNKANNPISIKDRDDKPSHNGPINLSKSNFDFLYVIGRGGFGKVTYINPGMESIPKKI